MRHTVDHKTRHLVTLAQDGDESALNQLCKVYWARVLWIVRLRMGQELRCKMDSVDLAQEAFVSALSDLPNFTYKSEGDFLRWLSRITENRLRDSLDRLHANKRDIRKEVRLDSSGTTTGGKFVGIAKPVDSTTPSAIMSKREEFDELAKAMDTLKPEYREVIMLTKIEGLSYKEIADRLSKSSEAVRKLVSRAMAALTTVFESV